MAEDYTPTILNQSREYFSKYFLDRYTKWTSLENFAEEFSRNFKALPVGWNQKAVYGLIINSETQNPKQVNILERWLQKIIPSNTNFNTVSKKIANSKYSIGS